MWVLGVPGSARGHRAGMDHETPRASVNRDQALVPVVLAGAIDAAELRSLRRSGGLERVRRGAYVAPAPSRGPALDRRDRALARIEAVAAQLSSEYWFSHETAALIWGCDVVGLSGRTHVTQEWRASRRGDPELVRHTLALAPSDRTVHRGLPVTTLERTVVDCAASMAGQRAVVVGDSALRLGADLDVVTAVLAARVAHRGVRRARLVIGRLDGRAESPGESLTRWLLVDEGLPVPEPQVEVRTARGTFRLDLAWRARRVAVEFDGYVKYSGGFGAASDVVFAEKLRQEALEEAGWLVVRATWRDLDRPDALLRRVRSALSRRS